LSKRIQREASEGKYNTLLDGTGDSSIESLKKKIAVMKSSGQKVVAHYVTVDTNVAVARNLARAEKTGRYVPESFIRGTHSSISRVMPEAAKLGLYDEFAVWDTNTHGKSILIANGEGKKLVVHDEVLWKRFLDKGNE